jgi:hypothetical protein
MSVSSDPQNGIDLDLRHSSQVELETVRQQVTNLVVNHAVELVSHTLEHIKRGNHQAMKYLFEMVGLFPATTPEETPAEDSLARTLLSYLGIPDASNSSTQATTPDPGEKVDSDAVE